MILQKIKDSIFIFGLMLFFFVASSTFAKKNDGPSDIKIPRSNLTLKLRSKSFQDEGVLAERIIDVKRSGKMMRVDWMAITKSLEEARYPTYKIKARKGSLEFSGFEGKTGLFHPLVWQENYTLLSDASPLWMAPEYLELRRRKEKEYHLGFLKVKATHLKGLTPRLYEEILYFRNLYEHYEKESQTKRTFLKSFKKDFFNVEFESYTGFHVVVNSQSLDLPAKVIGNRYYQMTVLDQKDNPLILKLEFFPNKAPKAFKRSFDFLAQNFEYRITRIDF